MPLADQNARTGDPLMRPVFYDYPDALKLSCDPALTFTVGRDLLVSAPPRPESPQPFDICLPAGGWYDYWTGLRVTKDKLTERPKLDVVPVFVRAGSDPAAPAAGAKHVRDAERAIAARRLSGRRLPWVPVLRRRSDGRGPEPAAGN